MRGQEKSVIMMVRMVFDVVKSAYTELQGIPEFLGFSDPHGNQVGR